MPAIYKAVVVPGLRGRNHRIHRFYLLVLASGEECRIFKYTLVFISSQFLCPCPNPNQRQLRAAVCSLCRAAATSTAATTASEPN